MISDSQHPSDALPDSSPSAAQDDEEKILCPHCRRTASNGIKCKGICVADDDY